MTFRSIFILAFSALCIISCATDNSSLASVESFLKARNSYDTNTLKSLTNEDYKEMFKNSMVEIKSRKDLLAQVEWAKELSSTTIIKEVVSESDSLVVLIEESTNYIDVALGKKPRSFKTAYYLKDDKVFKQSYDFAPGEKSTNTKDNERLYEAFEGYCKANGIEYSWKPTKEAAKSLRKALEIYANRSK